MRKVMGTFLGMVIGLVIGLMVIKPLISDFITGKIEESVVAEAAADFREAGFEIEKVEGTSLFMMTPDGKIAIDVNVIDGTFWTTSQELKKVWEELGLTPVEDSWY